jgi:hypothetical protein
MSLAKTLKARLGELNGQPGEAIRDIRSGFDASMATIDLIVATRRNILPRAIVDKWVELNGKHKSAKAAAMWDAGHALSGEGLASGVGPRERRR